LKLKSFSISILTAMAVLMIMGLLTSPLQASQYLGEITWNATLSPANGGDTFIVKAGLSKVGGPYYEIQGYIPGVPGGGSATFSGGGALVGNTLMLTVNITSQGGTKGNQVQVMQFNVDPSNYNGSLWGADPQTRISTKDVFISSDPFPAPNFAGTFPDMYSTYQNYVSHSHLQDDLVIWDYQTTGTLTKISGPSQSGIAPLLPLLDK
jgi:hypothetical protein